MSKFLASVTPETHVTTFDRYQHGKMLNVTKNNITLYLWLPFMYRECWFCTFCWNSWDHCNINEM